MSEAVELALVPFRAWVGDRKPGIGLVLGSGLGALADDLERAATLPYAELTGLPSAGVEGHAGEFVLGRLDGHDLLVQRGRFHGYEGHPEETVVLPVQLMARLGVRTLILTNAAGGIHPNLDPGALMLIAEHINLTCSNPLIGPSSEAKQRFPDLSNAYTPELRGLARASAIARSIRLEEGTYAGVTGPSYETAAEIRMLQRLGADAVGMSTVQEVIAARALGLNCLGVSIITNRAAGLTGGRLAHDEVLVQAGEAGASLGRLLREVLSRLR